MVGTENLIACLQIGGESVQTPPKNRLRAVFELFKNSWKTA